MFSLKEEGGLGEVVAAWSTHSRYIHGPTFDHLKKRLITWEKRLIACIVKPARLGVMQGNQSLTNYTATRHQAPPTPAPHPPITGRRHEELRQNFFAGQWARRDFRKMQIWHDGTLGDQCVATFMQHCPRLECVLWREWVKLITVGENMDPKCEEVWRGCWEESM